MKLSIQIYLSCNPINTFLGVSPFEHNRTYFGVGFHRTLPFDWIESNKWLGRKPHWKLKNLQLNKHAEDCSSIPVTSKGMPEGQIYALLCSSEQVVRWALERLSRSLCMMACGKQSLAYRFLPAFLSFPIGMKHVFLSSIFSVILSQPPSYFAIKLLSLV